MKQLIQTGFKGFFLLLLASFYQAIVLAQDSTSSSTKITTSTSTETSTWYTEPWVWVVGGAVFILLIVALVRGSSSNTSNTDRVTVTKTVTRDNDVA